MKRLFGKTGCFCAMLMALTGFTCSSRSDNNSAMGYTDFSAEEFKSFLESSDFTGGLLLDVRTEDEYNSGHIGGAVLIPVGDLPGRIGEIDAYKNKPVMVYCRSGKRSMMAVEQLKSAGFKKIYNLKGGIISWTAAGYPIE